MKPSWLITMAVFFCIFFTIGLWMGMSLGNLPSLHDIEHNLRYLVDRLVDQDTGVPTSSDPRAGDETWLPLQGENQSDFWQRSVLVIGVDDLRSPNPQLDSVWMVMYIPSLTSITIMPVYPTAFLKPDGLQVALDSELAKNYDIDQNGLIKDSFFAYLRAIGMPWQASIVVDHQAVTGLINFMSKSQYQAEEKAGKSPSYPRPALNLVSDLNTSLEVGAVERISVVQDICRLSFKADLTPTMLRELFMSLSGHFSTELPAEWFIHEFGLVLRYSSGMRCDFPSLDPPNAGPLG